MTPIDGLERQLTTGLTDLAGTSAPDYRDDILRQVARTRQRPTWTFPERWTPHGCHLRTTGDRDARADARS